MNMFVSIFGGMLLTVILFGAARAFKLSNFWAAVISAGLPSFAYMAYSVTHWPGLDMLTMHVVAFPTVALLLFQIGGVKNAPHVKLHWAPKLLIGFFVIITAILGTFVYIAGNGVSPAVAQWLLPNIDGKAVHTGFAGVVPHGDEASKSIAHQRNMQRKLANLGWNVEVSGLDALRPVHVTEVRVTILDNQMKPVTGVQVGVLLSRPGQFEQNQFIFTADDRGGYRTQIALPAPGEWLATLTLKRGGELILLERALGRE